MYSQAAAHGNTARNQRWNREAEQAEPKVARSANLKVIDAFGSVVLVPRDQEIFAEGASAEFCYRVVAGAVRLVKQMSDGRRQIVEFHLPHDLFAFNSCDTRYVSAEAVVDTTLIRYPRARIEALAERDFGFAGYLRTMASDSLRRAHGRMALLGRKSAMERIATFLHEMSQRKADAEDEAIELPMSRGDIADYLGLTLETVSRVLNRLHRDHVITLASATHIEVSDRHALDEIGGDL